MLRRNLPMTIFLFLIMTLHTATLGCFQWPHSFLSREFTTHPLLYKMIFYSTAILVSLLHQPISKKIGLKMELAGGVISSALGMLLFNAHAIFFPSGHLIMILSMILMGIAMLSVINCLLTYVVLVFSNKTLLGIIALLAFGNGGMMLAPQLLRLGAHLQLTTELIFLIITLLLMYGAGILILFDEPSYTQDPALQTAAYLRREMPLRFPLYLGVLAVYGLIESTFSLWGEGLLSHTFSLTPSRLATSLFWLAMVVCQILSFFLLHIFDPKKFCLFLCSMIFAAFCWMSFATSFSTLVIGMVIGGIGCSVIYSITLFFLTKEIQFFSQNNRDRYLSLIENGVSWMTASYMLTVGLTDIITDWLDRYSKIPFLIGIIYVFILLCLIVYLNQTRRQEI